MSVRDDWAERCSAALARHYVRRRPKRSNTGCHWARLLLAQRGVCGICGDPIRYDDLADVQVARLFIGDHIVPLSRGGGNHLANLQAAHGHCNESKGSEGATRRL